MGSEKIAVLIPCYNEAQTIEKVVKDFQTALPEAEIYVYDNNSTDGTDAIAKNAGAFVCYEKDQGKGCVVRSMFRDIDADCYIMTDGDDTYPAESAPKMAELILDKKLRQLQSRLSAKNITLEMSDEARKYLLEKGYTKQYGAREMDRAIQGNLNPLLMREILFGKLKKGGVARISLNDGVLVIS